MRWKNIAAVILMLCFCLPFTGTYTYLHFKKKQIRAAVRKQIFASVPDEELVVLKFAVGTELLRWEHSSEFEYDGNMYDVVSSVQEGDSVTYRCIPDIRETKVKRSIKELLAKKMGSDPKSKEQHKRLMDFCKALFFQQFRGYAGLPFFAEESTGTAYTMQISDMYFPPPLPPPKSCFMT